VGPVRRAPARPVPAGHRGRPGLARGAPGRPLAGRSRVLVR
jgi:hypothetical protein